VQGAGAQVDGLPIPLDQGASIERQFARFLAKKRVVVPLIWKLFLAQVLTPFRFRACEALSRLLWC
jgi:hypothetical protein